MSKRNEGENRSSSSSSKQTLSPKRNRRSSSTVMEVSKQYEALSLEQFKQIMEKLSRLDNQMQEHFGNLTSEISILRHEMKQELGVKKSLRDVRKSNVRLLPGQTKFFSLRVLMDPTNRLLMFFLIYLFILASYLSVCVVNIYFFSLVIQISCILETSLRFSIAFISIHELSL